MDTSRRGSGELVARLRSRTDHFLASSRPRREIPAVPASRRRPTRSWSHQNQRAVLFAGIARTFYHSGYLSPFAPHGISGIGLAASSIFFSFIGLDAVSTAGEEVKEPRRTMPLAILITLVVAHRNACPEHSRRRYRRRSARRVCPAGRPHRPHQPGHPGRLHGRLGGCHHPAPRPTRSVPRLQGPRLSDHPTPEHRFLPLSDLRPAHGDLRHVRGVVSRRGGPLLRLRHQALPPDPQAEPAFERNLAMAVIAVTAPYRFGFTSTSTSPLF
jgi:hypothetical protein